MPRTSRMANCVWLFPVLLALGHAPANAQVNLAGVWNNLQILHEDEPERLPGPELGDYLGVPINAAARYRADAWDASLITLPEYQCRVHPSDYVPSFAGMRIWEEFDKDTQQLIAIHTHHFAWGTERTIWMDGRPHPPEYALHTSQGFSTGKWEGDVLAITTTHLKEGWIRRNGLPRSDRAVVTEHFIRHGDNLTIMTVIRDPAYLTEPFIRTRDYLYEIGGQIAPYPCESVEEVIRPKGVIPHHLPGHQQIPGRIPGRACGPAAGRARRSRHYVSRISRQDPRHSSGNEGGREMKIRILLAFLFAAAGLAFAQGQDSEVHVWPVQGNIYMIVGAGGNVTVQTGKDGVLVVDTGLAPMADKMLAAIKSISNGPIRYIINTHYHPDHTGGNAKIRLAGSTIVGANVTGDIKDAGVGAQLFRTSMF